MPTVRVLPGDRSITVAEADGRDLLSVLAAHGILLESECGGEGTCGKCLVELLEGTLTGICGGAAEPDRDGLYLACRCRPSTDCTVRVSGQATESSSPEEFLAASIGPFAAGPSPSGRLGVAVDMGTTTVVALLADLESGSALTVRSETNPQRSYGADVISRIAFAVGAGGEEPGIGVLQRVVVECIDRLIGHACEAAGAPLSGVESIVCVGNTPMQHFLLGVTPVRLGCLPYQAEFKEVEPRPAGSLGLASVPHATLRVLPNVASFVGADTVGCLLAVDSEQPGGLSVMVDMGTNTEMVTGRGEDRAACSAAAGPAFEGARLQHGMRAVPGAIGRVWLEEDHLAFETIGGERPLGICGSGVVDAVACLRRLGVIEVNGRMAGRAEYVLAEAAESGTGHAITITRQDVREIQLVKASIATGLGFLLERSGAGYGDIERFFVAGAFGNYLDIDNSRSIGLLPDLPPERFRPVGDAALKGACLALTGGRRTLDRARDIAFATDHVELAGSPDFQPRFIDALGLAPYGR
ncbi:MAG: DUF4445 domain-containing protein [Actinobacteria bacterium]|nr:DUF4445 domain-containing protein [Actinomycetota bacterium]MBU1944418.1 DUF4445 domain-containing protein [Actinomycetota bacterium]MBU2688204.1 DUF4445 domain-containing protein [Actinomycetota bacterium]